MNLGDKVIKCWNAYDHAIMGRVSEITKDTLQTLLTIDWEYKDATISEEISLDSLSSLKNYHVFKIS